MPTKEARWVGAWYGVFGLWSWLLFWQLDPVPHLWLWLLLGYFLADAGSYLFHYVVDHYGDPSEPGVVRAFQAHHLEPWGIARRPLSEVLYPAARIITPVMGLLLPLVWAGVFPSWLVLLGYLLGSLWVFTQLFHRWSHMPRANPLIRTLQRLHLVVGVAEHDRHHRPPFDSHFAVINGWSNPVLDVLGAPALVDGLMARFGIGKRGLQASLDRLAKDFS